MDIFDTRICKLGEGPLWHPLQQRWYWFDILNQRLLGKDNASAYQWQFAEHVSACAWVDAKQLLIASESQLFLLNTHNSQQTLVIDLEADNPITRSNDGRADPWGGFWIGTMGKQAQAKQGAIYRYYQGELVCLYQDITISNAICFSHDKQFAYYCDTPTQMIMRQPLDQAGFPQGASQLFIDLRGTDYFPDGAVVDFDGYLWNAQWGTARIARYTPDGSLDKVIHCGAQQVSCPAFGGVNTDLLLATTAADGAGTQDTLAGMTFLEKQEQQGRFEYPVNVITLEPGNE